MWFFLTSNYSETFNISYLINYGEKIEGGSRVSMGPVGLGGASPPALMLNPPLLTATSLHSKNLVGSTLFSTCILCLKQMVFFKDGGSNFDG